jgi:hypothetical protein
MSAAIEVCSGRVHIFRQGAGQGGVGFYSLNPSIDVGNGAKVLITGAPLVYQEIVQPVVTLDDRQFLYVFGSAWTESIVQGKILMGGNENRGALLALTSWYNKNNVTKRGKAPLELSMGDGGAELYLVGLRVDAANSEYNTQDFTLIFQQKAD